MSEEKTLEERVEAILTQVRPYIKSDGYDAVIDECSGENVSIWLIHPPATCASQRVLTTLALRYRIMKELPEVLEVVVKSG